MPGPHTVIHRERCYNPKSALTMSHITDLRTAKVFGRPQTDLRSQISQCSHQTLNHQVYGASAPPSAAPPRGLDGMPRHPGCLPTHSDTPIIKEIPVLRGERTAFRIHLPPVRTKHSSSGLHFHPQTNSQHTERREDQHPSISRRSHSLGYLSTGLRGGDPAHGFRPPATRVSPKQGQIPTVTKADQRLAGVSLELDNPICCTHATKSGKNKTPLQPHPPKRRDKSSGHGEPNGSSGLRGPAPPQDPIPQKVPHSKYEETPKSKCTGSPHHRTQNPPPDMGLHRRHRGGRNTASTSARHHDLDRRIKTGLGFSRRHRKHQQRIMDSPTKRSPYQRARTVDHQIRNRQSPCQTKFECRRLHRQCSRVLRLLQTRFDKSATDAQNLWRHPQNCPEEGTVPVTQTHPRHSQRPSRCSIPTRTDFHGVGTGSPRLCEDPTLGRPTPSGPNGNTIQRQTADLRMPLPTSEGSSGRRALHSVEQMAEDLPLPAIWTYRSPNASNTNIQGNLNPDPQPTLLRNAENSTPVLGNGLTPVALPTIPEVGGQDALGTMVNICSMDRATFLHRAFSRQFGPELAQTLISAFRVSTRRQQEHAWNALQEWLRQTPATVLSLPLLLQFTRWLRVSKNLASQTIAAYKSALMLPLKEACGLDLSDPHFSLIMKSLFLEKPPIRPQALRWDLNKVLRFLRSPRFHKTKVKEEDLLHKCLILIALATGNRGAELAALTREGICTLQDGSLKVAVTPGFLYKNQAEGRNPPPVLVAPLPRNQLCPVASLKHYLEMSKLSEGRLFIHPRSHRPLNRGQIALRVCTLIKEADPTGVPQMHDLRRAAASIAWTRGVPPSQIVKSAFWSRSDTFIKRYLRKCPNPKCIALGTRSEM